MTAVAEELREQEDQVAEVMQVILEQLEQII